jgi:MFS family permease
MYLANSMYRAKVRRAAFYVARDPLITAQFLLVIAYSMLSFLLAVALFSDASLWVLGLAMAVPALVHTAIGTVASFASDRMPRNVLYALGMFMLVPAAVLGLVARTQDGVFGAPDVLLPLAYFVSGAGFAVSVSAATVLVPLRFADEELGVVNSALMALAMVASTLGPLMGAVFRAESPQLAYSVVIGTASLAFTVALRSRERVRSSSAARGRPPHDERSSRLDAARAVLKSRTLLLMTLALSLTWLGVGGINAVEIPFIIHDLDGGTNGYAFILSWTSIWSFVFSSSYAILGRRISPYIAFLFGTIGMSVGWIGFALAPSLWLALPAVLVTGLTGVLLNVGSAAILQALARREARIGGVLGLVFATFHIAGALSLIAFAAVADFVLSVRAVLVIEGMIAACAIPVAVKVLREQGVAVRSSRSALSGNAERVGLADPVREWSDRSE